MILYKKSKESLTSFLVETLLAGGTIDTYELNTTNVSNIELELKSDTDLTSLDSNITINLYQSIDGVSYSGIPFYSFDVTSSHPQVYTQSINCVSIRYIKIEMVNNSTIDYGFTLNHADTIILENVESNILNNTNSTIDPSPINDSSEGYSVGSRWVNKSTNIVYLCVDSTQSSAQWIPLNDLSDYYIKSEVDAIVDQHITDLIDGSPDALNTLNEISTALNNDPDLANTLTTEINKKVDKITGKGLSTNDLTDILLSKINGISEGATKTEISSTNGNLKIDGTDHVIYTHPVSHPASMITEDSTRRFVTDVQISNWDDKYSTSEINSQMATKEDKSDKGVANGYASLDSNAKVPLAELPDIAKQATHVVTDITTRDSLTGLIEGDRSYITSTGDSYIWDGAQWLLMADADWQNVSLDWANVSGRPSPTITLSGDVSGSGIMELLESVNINVTVTDDSHRHDTMYYTKPEVDSKTEIIIDGGRADSIYVTAETIDGGTAADV